MFLSIYLESLVAAQEELNVAKLSCLLPAHRFS